jgi:hypothetical protein
MPQYTLPVHVLLCGVQNHEDDVGRPSYGDNLKRKKKVNYRNASFMTLFPPKRCDIAKGGRRKRIQCQSEKRTAFPASGTRNLTIF